MTTGPLQVRRGTAAQNNAITPALGEPLFTTDAGKELRVGDGAKTGGQYAMGSRNRRRLLSSPVSFQARHPAVTKLIDVGWWEDPAAGGGTGWSTKQGYTLTPQSIASPWECFARGRVPAGSFVGGSWIDIFLTFTVEAWDGAKNLVLVPGVVWDFNGTKTAQAAMNSGNYACFVRHDSTAPNPSETDWEDGYVAYYHFRLIAQGYTEHWAHNVIARVYDEGASPGTGFNPVYTSVHEGKCYRNTLDMSVDHDLYLGATWLNDGGTPVPANDIRVRSAAAYLYGWTGGVATDLKGTTS